MIRFLTIEEVVMINHIAIKKYSPDEMIGVKSVDLLESAVNRPKQSAFGKDAYKTIFEKAAALFESLAQNHPFHNANKRVAFLSMLQFIKYNGYNLVMSQKEAEIFTFDVVLKKINTKEISEKIKKNCKKI
jgi:death-on-curing protein